MRKVENRMSVRDPKIQKDIQTMVAEAEEISSDLSSYFYYHQNKEQIVEKMLSESNQN